MSVMEIYKKEATVGGRGGGRRRRKTDTQSLLMIRKFMIRKT